MKKILLGALLIATAAMGQTTYVYERDVDGRKSKTTWVVDLQDTALRIRGEGPQGHTLIIASPKRVTKSFQHQSSNGSTTYSIVCDGSHLTARRKRGGREIERHYQLGTRLWIQEFDFTFRPFILSNEKRLAFSIIHPRKLDLHNMVATKESRETLQLREKIWDSLKVRVTLTGLKKMFWHADLWFDPHTGDLLKYRANEGPNTPTSVITLLSKSPQN